MSILNTVSIAEAHNLLSAVITNSFERGDTPQNAFLHGSPGLGKSSIVTQIAKELGAELIDVRLAGMEPSDVQGIPYIADGEMKYSTPSWFPTDPSKKYILFFDELSNCIPAVQHAAYRIILDRTIQNGTKMPNSVAIVGAGNLKEDKTGARPLLPAAANRFGLHLFIDQGKAAESFLDFAVRNGAEPSLVAFLSYKKEAVFSNAGDEVAFATPRSWMMVDAHLKNKKINNNDYLLGLAVAGAVGSVAYEYMGFREVSAHLPEWDRVASGDSSYQYDVPVNDDHLLYSIAVSGAYEIVKYLKSNSNKEIDRICEVVFSHLPKEIIIVLMRTIARSDGNISTIGAKILGVPSLRDMFFKVKEYIKL